MTWQSARPVAISNLLLIIGFSHALAQMPLETSPSYESTPLGHVATGGAWADVDGDGWLDMVVANGNDISRQRVSIYHNDGAGNLPLTPTWESLDIDYHGHLDVGDINGDGLVDVAVGVYIGPAGFSEPGKVKVYLNDGAGDFTSLPVWTSESFYCFSVALGDADGDGDLDLACTSGEQYFGDPDTHRIYMNENGTLEATPSWVADDLGFALDVFWGDVENDGDLDVVFCGSTTAMRVYLNAQTTGGGIATSPSWQSTDMPQFGNTTAFGDVNGDGYPELAVADNDQLGGAGEFKYYANTAGALSTTPVWTSTTGGYGSHVSWVDLDVDGDLDLGSGRWFSRSYIYENLGDVLAVNPVWTSDLNSVVENMFWGDMDNQALHPDGHTVATGDGARTLVQLGHSPVRSVDEVRVDGAPLAADAYVSHLVYGWISLATPPAAGESIEVDYTYSTRLDLGVTNWDSSIGNFVYQNTTIDAVPAVATALQRLQARPNPVSTRTQIRYRGEGSSVAQLTIHDVTGREVRRLHEGVLAEGLWTWEWDARGNEGHRVADGIYFARLRAGTLSGSVKLIVLR